MVVDDDFDACTSVSKMLKQIGMRAEWTTSGREAAYRAKNASEEGDSYHTCGHAAAPAQTIMKVYFHTSIYWFNIAIESNGITETMNDTPQKISTVIFYGKRRSSRL